MALLRNYEVTVPPTSGEARDLALKKQREGKPLRLTVRPEATDFDPEPAETDLEFRVELTRSRDDGSFIIVGQNAVGNAVNLRTDTDQDAPASLTLVL